MKQEIIKQILKDSNLSYRKACAAFDCKEGTSLGKFARGLRKMDDFILLCDYAGIKITLTYPDGRIQEISKNDI